MKVWRKVVTSESIKMGVALPDENRYDISMIASGRSSNTSVANALFSCAFAVTWSFACSSEERSSRFLSVVVVERSGYSMARPVEA